jgi:hypothetical protein
MWKRTEGVEVGEGVSVLVVVCVMGVSEAEEVGAVWMIQVVLWKWTRRDLGMREVAFVLRLVLLMSVFGGFDIGVGV